jgi:cytochrome c
MPRRISSWAATILATALATALGACGADKAPSSQAGSSPPAFAICSSCHAVTPGAHGIGPSLAGVYGRPAASLAGYAYSPALKGSGLTWDAATLDRWLQGSQTMVPGTRMPLYPVSDPAARKQIVDYLATLK